ncbi:BZ3500_MvSof-1268-A1-R1_Chr1-3g01776 [Microbotryum saponariae]|uniref:BZ3500_MvSof-1268-A1-R1_Chr1-3g01776 protein n=1 Tax=Microbotryum saponariae TaxID=289078 RepID=A0A2X0M7N8_9BASI|nr:BZ3500_MvSof-1268-A1-R1_Chr1-3g01776 [Microbotryum saponariae]
MTASQTIETGHVDSIHDAQLDYYGRRLATGSSDRTIRLFEVEGDDRYRLVDTLRGHDGPIHALAWAHPSFGSILASCSFDGKVFVWKENDGPQKGWSKVKEHLLHTASVNAIAWAPHELGPILACASSDGKVSVLTFNDNGTWDASLFPAHALGVTSISWAPAVGVGALTSVDGQQDGGPLAIQQVKRFATGGCDALVKIWVWEEETKSWSPDPIQPILEGHVDWVRDVAWAPSVGVGRAYLASAGQDKTVYIWTQDSPRATWNKVALEPTPSAPTQAGAGAGGEGKFGEVVWRVSWSVSGNVLAVSSGDGKVSLWKENLKGKFEEVSELTSDPSAMAPDGGESSHVLQLSSSARAIPTPADLFNPVPTSSFFGSDPVSSSSPSSSSSPYFHRASMNPTDTPRVPPPRLPAWTNGARPSAVYDDALHSTTNRVRSGSSGSITAATASTANVKGAVGITSMSGVETSSFRKPSISPKHALPTLPLSWSSISPQFARAPPPPPLPPSSQGAAVPGKEFGGEAMVPSNQQSKPAPLGWALPPQPSTRGDTTGWEVDPSAPLTSSTLDHQQIEFAPPPFAIPHRTRTTRARYGFSNIAGLGWTAPKILEKPVRGGVVGGIWQHGVWDFKVVDTPENYPPMGELPPKPVKEPTTESLDAMQVDGETTKRSDAVVAEVSMQQAPPPHKTISRAELDQARPHPHLYYVPRQHAWALFAHFEQTDAHRSFVDDGQVRLWVSSYETAEVLLKRLEPPLPTPFEPFDTMELPLPAREVFDAARRVCLDPEPEYVTKIDEPKSGRSILFSEQELYPCVIPMHVLHELLRTRSESPSPGDSAEDAKLNAIQTLWRSLDNLLFKAEQRPLSINGKAFARCLPWDELTRAIFVAILGFRLTPEETLCPPNLVDSTDEGRVNRHRLLRCWLELGLWIEHVRKLEDQARIRRVATRVELSSGVDAMKKILGPDTLARVPASSAWAIAGRSAMTAGFDGPVNLSHQLAQAYHFLGVTPDLADSVVEEVYKEQVGRCSAYTADFLEAIQEINHDRHSDVLEMLIATERSIGRVSLSDLRNAYKELGLEFDHSRSVTDDEIAFRFGQRREQVTDPERKKVLKEAMKQIADQRDSELLKVMLLSANDEEDRPAMSLEKAYKLLEATPEMSDEILSMVYDVRIADAPGQVDVMTQALATIGQAIGSDAIRVKLGGDTAALIPQPAPDMPVGLTNIANTCYLNSLLQYFFTIRELREAVLRFQPTPTTDVSALNRVGGRLVTKAEVERSKKFVVLLQTLFNQLIHSPSTSITPETELAYLALVPSKDEAEVLTTTSPADDLVILNDPARTSGSPIATTSMLPPTSDDSDLKSPSSSILGKRRNSHLDSDIKGSLALDQVRIESSQAQSPNQSSSDGASPPADLIVDLEAASVLNREKSGASLSRSSSKTVVGELLGSSDEQRKMKRGKSVDGSIFGHGDEMKVDDDDDEVIILEPPTGTSMTRPPTLPPRPRRPSKAVTKLEDQVSNYMSFGRQNDVTECMDNVMFQIECALNPDGTPDEPSGSATTNDVSTSVLRRTLYGKMRQHLEFTDPSVPEPIRIREEPFFSLLVDVAEEGHTVYDGLDTVFDDSIVTIEGHEARRRMRLVDVPPILQIQLQRVQYDRVAQRIFKSNAHLDFGETLSLDRYLEVEEGDVEAAQRQAWTQSKRDEIEIARTKLMALKSTKTGTSYGTSIKEAFAHLSTLKDELGDLLTSKFAHDSLEEAVWIDQQIVELETRINDSRKAIEECWAAQAKTVYELAAVFIHRGTALSGHYFIYQRDSKHRDRWLKYNDSVITDVSGEDKVYLRSRDDTNAYFLVYCRRDRLDSIESIAREF